MSYFNNYNLKQNSGDNVFYKKCKTIYNNTDDRNKNMNGKKMNNSNYLKYKYGKSLCASETDSTNPNYSKKGNESKCSMGVTYSKNTKTKMCLGYKKSQLN